MAMFDKHKSSKPAPEREEKPAVARPAPEQPAPAAGSATGGPPRVAMIGPGIGITGDVAAKSDLKVEGRIEGRSVSSSHDVEVSESGIIKASISARVVKVAGAVAGDINGSEKVMIAKSGRVQGNIVAPRVQLDDGALFRGSIDMNPAEPAGTKKAERGTPKIESFVSSSSKTQSVSCSIEMGRNRSPMTSLLSGSRLQARVQSFRLLGSLGPDLDRVDPECELPGLVANEPRETGGVNCILNNSFGMLGINSVVIVKRI